MKKVKKIEILSAKVLVILSVTGTNLPLLNALVKEIESFPEDLLLFGLVDISRLEPGLWKIIIIINTFELVLIIENHWDWLNT